MRSAEIFEISGGESGMRARVRILQANDTIIESKHKLCNL